MNTSAQHAPTHADALNTAQPLLHALLESAEQLGCTLSSDLYGNVLIHRSGSTNGAPIQVGFSDEHCALIQATLGELTTAQPRAIECVYLAPTLNETLEYSAWPKRMATPAHAFIGLALNPPPEQHLYAHWYQIRCSVAEQGAASSMAQSHHAIVRAFHSITRIQALAEKLAGHSRVQLSFSRLHLVPEQQVQVNLTVRHPEAAVLEAFAEQLPHCLPAASQAQALLRYQNPVREQAFNASVARLCQHLATRAYPLASSALHDAAYLASAGPSALVTLNSSSAHAKALARCLSELAQ